MVRSVQVLPFMALALIACVFIANGSVSDELQAHFTVTPAAVSLALGGADARAADSLSTLLQSQLNHAETAAAATAATSAIAASPPPPPALSPPASVAGVADGTCHARMHTDYMGEQAPVWGLGNPGFHLKDPAECCAACQAHAAVCGNLDVKHFGTEETIRVGKET